MKGSLDESNYNEATKSVLLKSTQNLACVVKIALKDNIVFMHC
jgi:hypothetical protein